MPRTKKRREPIKETTVFGRICVNSKTTLPDKEKIEVESLFRPCPDVYDSFKWQEFESHQERFRVKLCQNLKIKSKYLDHVNLPSSEETRRLQLDASISFIKTVFRYRYIDEEVDKHGKLPSRTQMGLHNVEAMAMLRDDHLSNLQRMKERGKLWPVKETDAWPDQPNRELVITGESGSLPRGTSRGDRIKVPTYVGPDRPSNGTPQPGYICPEKYRFSDDVPANCKIVPKGHNRVPEGYRRAQEEFTTAEKQEPVVLHTASEVFIFMDRVDEFVDVRRFGKNHVIAISQFYELNSFKPVMTYTNTGDRACWLVPAIGASTHEYSFTPPSWDKRKLMPLRMTPMRNLPTCACVRRP